jgi:hypothetical protein
MLPSAYLLNTSSSQLINSSTTFIKLSTAFENFNRVGNDCVNVEEEEEDDEEISINDSLATS